MVPGCATNECPVSLITGYSQTVVLLAARAKTLATSGVNLYSEGSRLSSKFVDALEIVASEGSKVESAVAARPKSHAE